MSVWQEGMWGYNGCSADDGCKEWQSLEEGILFVLEKLNPVKPIIRKLKRKYRLVIVNKHEKLELTHIWCQQAFGIDPVTSVEI